MSVEEMLLEYGELIEKETIKFLKDNIAEAEKYHPFIKETFELLKDYIFRPGKRLASISTLLIYKGYKGKVDDQILKVCAGIEIYRHSILIHDDLVDLDGMRRGELSIHKLFENLMEERCVRGLDAGRGFPSFGESMAVFTGNILLSLAFKSINKAGFDRDLTTRVIGAINKDFQFVNESQILDLLFEFSPPNKNEWEIMASKRASQLFKTTLTIGAILAEVPEEELKMVEECGSHIGFAFDIIDDIIGAFTTEEVYGRPSTGDIILGKKPLHVTIALEKATPNKKQKLLEILKNKTKTDEEILEAKDIMREYGLTEAKKAARNHATEAIKILEKLKIDEKTKQSLKQFIEYVAENLNWYT
ncbi:MAG: polyprenyl synthetase family protein [Candidatus Wukongarchaeota archaeon]|nr:polyprenyl synthetase family protein [Candidatus Wukongarchaeota archaeon]MDO8128553.1 polyprenyl synthetase family protein [Candidatus Wukongarchaeota archaeon]